ncbi:hypothetical protein EZS27_033546 [termite gut metagenome]|uniref:Uncharacterized protein n=1 Tax=termite gut metagenome TaxID=433724 RepID=A0A5J4Q4W4_9ZZZZ
MYNSWLGFTAVIMLVSTVMTLGYFNYLDKKRVELSFVDNRLKIEKNHQEIKKNEQPHITRSLQKRSKTTWKIFSG